MMPIAMTLGIILHNMWGIIVYNSLPDFRHAIAHLCKNYHGKRLDLQNAFMAYSYSNSG